MQNHFKVKPQAKYATLDQLLHEYRQNGVDSEGQFTLNPVRARELLEQFQLPEPSYYALHLVSFLIGAGARAVSIFSSKGQIRYEAPGAQLDTDTLKSPFSVLLKSGASAHLSELALALNTVLGQPNTRVEVSYGKSLATYTSEEIRVVGIAPTEPPTIQVKARFGKPGADRELELIREAFRWTTVPIRINGQGIPIAGYTHQEEGLELHLQNSKYPLLLGNKVEHRVTKPVTANFSALIRVGRHRPGLRLVFLGRDYGKPLPWDLQVPGWQVEVTVNTDSLKKDLSQQDILENELYKNLLAALRNQLEWATAFLLTQLPPPDSAEPLVDDLVEGMFQAGQVDQAFAYQSRLVQSLGLIQDKQKKGKAIFRLALMQERRGEADASQQRLGLELLRAAQSHDPIEPDWTILKARMAFQSPSVELVQAVNRFLTGRSVPLAAKEHCYRWLLKNGQRDPRETVVYRVELSRQIFETGRPAEALSELETAYSGEEGKALSENVDLGLRAARLRGEIAAQMGQMESSLKYLGIYLNGLREQHGQYSLQLGTTLEQLALILDHLGQGKQADEYRAWSKRLYQA